MDLKWNSLHLSFRLLRHEIYTEKGKQTSQTQQKFHKNFLGFKFEIQVYFIERSIKSQYWRKRYQTIPANQKGVEKVQVATFIQTF